MNRRSAIAVLLGVAALAAPGLARAAEVHGASEAFATPGVALAWGVLRGGDEASTRVVLRMDVDPAYADVAVVGIDPFTRASHALVQGGRGAIVVTAPREHFAQFPRTEVRLARAPGAQPDLVIYYVGLPDTTPEFADAAKLDAYIDERLQRLRSSSPRSP